MKSTPQRHAQIAVALIFVLLASLLYFLSNLPLWACVLTAFASILVNSFILRVEDGEFSGKEKQKS